MISGIQYVTEKLNLRCSMHGSYPVSTHEQIEHLHFEIHSQPQHNWKIPDIAAKYHISFGYLQRIYKEHYGISIMEDVLYVRLERAK